jgi:hypothetical protein
MNQEKAKEFFSAYREDALDAGLRVAFEAKLESDRALRADYEAFERSVAAVDELKFENISVPGDLSDKIKARIDLSLHQKSRESGPAVSRWFLNLALGGVAAAVIVATSMSLMNRGGQHGSIASGFGTQVGSSETMTFKPLADSLGIQMTYAPSTAKTVVVSQGVDGKELSRDDLNGKSVDRPLINDQPDASLLSVKIEGDNRTTLVALPGTRISGMAAGRGQIKDLAVALAGRYRQPMIVEVGDPTVAVTWDFKAPDLRHAAQDALASDKYSVVTLDSGLVKITDR